MTGEIIMHSSNNIMYIRNFMGSDVMSNYFLFNDIVEVDEIADEI